MRVGKKGIAALTFCAVLIGPAGRRASRSMRAGKAVESCHDEPRILMKHDTLLNRRTLFKTSLLAAGGAALGSSAGAAESRRNPSGVGGYDYRLPSFKPESHLVFQGDSITDMNWGRNERDRNHYLGHSYVYLIAARLGVDLAQAKLQFFNRGMSGHGIRNLRDRWQKDAIDMQPDLLSILIGINDTSNGADLKRPAAEWEADYRFMLEASRKANPELRLVLLDPFVLPTGGLKDPAQLAARRAQVDQLAGIVVRLAEDFQAVHIRTQEIYDAAARSAEPANWIWEASIRCRRAMN